MILEYPYRNPAKINKNILKNTGNVRIVVFTETSVKNYQLKQWEKLASSENNHTHFEPTDKWYMYRLESVLENETREILRSLRLICAPKANICQYDGNFE